jgi:hypothetical protein
VHMQRIGDRFSKENKTLFLRLTLVVLMGLSVLGVVHPANRGIGQSVMAARPAFDGTDTDLLERQNKAYEGIVQATTPAIVCIRAEQVVKTEPSSLFMDPSLCEFFGDLSTNSGGAVGTVRAVACVLLERLNRPIAIPFPSRRAEPPVAYGVGTASGEMQLPDHDWSVDESRHRDRGSRYLMFTSSADLRRADFPRIFPSQNYI